MAQIDKIQLQSYYQNPGDIYSDTKTESVSELIADQHNETDARLTTAVANAVAPGAVDTTKLKDRSVTRPKISVGAVGATELDPALLQNYGDIAVQAKFVKVDAQLADVATVYASSFKTASNDWGEAINAAIDSITSGKVLLPQGNLSYTHPIVQKSNITIEGQGVDVTVLKPIGCHGVTVTPNQFLRFAVIKNLTISGDNGGDNSTYNSSRHGINWESILESYQCRLERVRVMNCYGKGVYAPYDFNNVYDEVYVSKCGGNAIEVAGLNTCTLKNCYVDYVAPGKVGYRVYQNAVMISCNGLGGNSDYWGAFGRNGGLYEDSNTGQSQYNVSFIGCNIEDFRKIGCVFLFSGGFEFRNCSFYAPETGTYEYYIWAQTIAKMSTIDGNTIMQSKGATTTSLSRIYSNVTNATLLIYNGQNNITDGTNVIKLPKISSTYDSFLQQALEFDYINIKGMSYFYLGGKKHTFGTAVPTTGTWAVGDVVYNTNTTIGAWSGWACITAGTPGTWRPFGQVGVRLLPTSARPTLTALDIGYQYLDNTLSPNGKLVTWNGTNYVDATGTIV